MRTRLNSLIAVSSLVLAQSISLLSTLPGIAAPISTNFQSATTPTHTFLAPTAQKNSAIVQSLNLGATKATATVPQLLNHAPVSINVGGTKLSVSSRTVLTPAEAMAALQVIKTGQQSLLLSSTGSADGGSLTIGSWLPSQASTLVIPQGVTVTDVAKTGVLNLSGNLVDFGSLYLNSSNQAISNFSVQASNIKVGPQGIISTILPPGSPYASAAPANLGLTLTASNNISNAGTISAGGSLSLTAGGSITNALPHGASGTQPVIQAANNITLSVGSGQISNSGLINSTNGSINISTLTPATDLTINAAGGTFQALNGNINLRDSSYAGSNNINLSGGNYLSQNLNLYSGAGTITGFTNEISGNLNSVAGVEHFAADTSVLKLSNNTISGDPTFVNFGGAIEIDGTNTFGEDVTILATGDITAVDAGTPGAIIDHGNAVTLVAGAALTLLSGSGGDNQAVSKIPGDSGISQLAPGSTVQVDFSTGTGGNIDLSASSAPVVIDTTSGGPGGNVVLAALSFGGNGGNVTLSNQSGQGTINTYSIGQAPGGSVSIFAGANPGTPGTTIQVNNITTGGAGAGGDGSMAGYINISTSQPAASNNGTTFVTFDDHGSIGQQSPGVPQQIVAGALSASGMVSTGVLNAAGFGTSGQIFQNAQNGGNGGNVTVTAGAGISTASIYTFGGGGGGSSSYGAPTQGGYGGAGGAISLNSQSGNINVTGDLNSSGGGAGGSGGTSSSPSSSSGGNAGNILVQAQNGSVTVSNLILASSGGDGGGAMFTTGGGGGSFGAGGGGSSLSPLTGGSGGSGLFGGGGAGGTDLFDGPGGNGGGGGFAGSGGGGAGGSNGSGIGYPGGGGGGGAGSSPGDDSTGGIGGAGGIGAGNGGSGSGGGNGGAGGSGVSGAGQSGGPGLIGGAGGSAGTGFSTFGVGGDGPTALNELAGGSATATGGTVTLSGTSVAVNGSLPNTGGPFSGLSIVALGASGSGSVNITATGGSIAPTSIASPSIDLKSLGGNIGTSSFSPVEVSNPNFGGSVTLSAQANFVAGSVFISHNSAEQLTLVSSAGGFFYLNSTAQDSISGSITSNGLVSITTSGAIGSPSALTLNELFQLTASAPLGVNILLSSLNPISGSITSPNITISSGGFGLQLGTSGSPFNVGNNGSGVTLNISASNGAYISDSSKDLVTLANVGAPNSAFSLTAGGSVAQSGSIAAASFSISAAGNITADGTSSGGALGLTNSSTGIPTLYASAGSTGAINLSINSAVSLLNNSALGNSQSFSLSASGNITAANTSLTAIQAGTITINTSGNIGAGSSAPLIVNSNGSGTLHLFGNSGGTLDIADNASENIQLDNTSTNLFAATSFNLSYINNTGGLITQAVQTNTGIVSPMISLIDNATNFPSIGASTVAPITFNNGGQNVAISAQTGNLGNVFISHNWAEQLTLVNCQGGFFNLNSTAQDSISGNISSSFPTITTPGTIGSPTALLLGGVAGMNVSFSAQGAVNVSVTSSLNGTITSPTITILSQAQEIGQGSPLNVGNNGSGVNLNVGGAFSTSISDSSSELVTLSNVAVTGFALTSGGSVAQSGPIASASFSITAAGNITADGTSSGGPMLLTQFGSAPPQLYASASSTSTINLSINSAVALQNSSPLGKSQLFSLSASGDITAANTALTAVQAGTISLSASNGNIGSASNTPLLVNNNGNGVLLNFSATGTGAGQGSVWIADNSGTTESLTLSNTSNTAPTASTSANITNFHGNILAFTPTSLAISSPSLSLTAIGGDIVGSEAGQTALIVNSNNNVSGLSLYVNSTTVVGTGGFVSINDSINEPILLLNDASPLNAGSQFLLGFEGHSGSITAETAGSTTIVSPIITLNAAQGNVGTSPTLPLLVNGGGSGLVLSVSAGGSAPAQGNVWLNDDFTESLQLNTSLTSTAVNSISIGSGGNITAAGTGLAISSPSISLSAIGGNITLNGADNGGAINVSSGGTSGVLVYASSRKEISGGNVNIADSAFEPMIIANGGLNGAAHADVSFTLSAMGSIVQSDNSSILATAITSPVITLSAGEIGTSPQSSILFNNAGGGVLLSASSTTVAWLTDNNQAANGEAVALASNLSPTNSFNLVNFNGSITSAATSTQPVLTVVNGPGSANVSLNAVNGSIGTINAPIVISQNGTMTLSASASGQGSSGQVWIQTNSISPSAVYLNNLASPLSASTSFSLVNSNGGINASPSNPKGVAIVSQSISLTAINGNISADGMATAPLVIIASLNGSVPQLSLFASDTNSGHGAVLLADTNKNEPVAFFFATSQADFSFNLTSVGNILSTVPGTGVAAVSSPQISLTSQNGNITADGTANGGPLLINSGGNSGVSLFLSALNGVINLADNHSETISINTGKGIGITSENSVSLGFAAGTSGSIESTGFFVAISSPVVNLSAPNGSIFLSISGSGVGELLTASATGTAMGQGTINITENASAPPPEILTINSVSGASSVSINNLAGSILQEAGSTGITSPVIYLNASQGEIGTATGSGSLLINNGGNGVTLSASASGSGTSSTAPTGAGQVFITDNNIAVSGELVTLSQSPSSSATNFFSLSNSNGGIAAQPSLNPAIASPSISLSATNGSIGTQSASVSISGGMGSQQVLLQAAATGSGSNGFVYITTPTQSLFNLSPVTVVLNNGNTPLTASQLFNLTDPFGNIAVSTAGITAISSPSISLVVSGNISSDGTTSGLPVLINSGGNPSGLSLLATATGTGLGNGTVILSDAVAENVTLSNSAGALTALNFNLTTNGTIQVATTAAAAIKAPTITLLASSGSIGVSNGTPLIVTALGQLRISASASSSNGSVFLQDNDADFTMGPAIPALLLLASSTGAAGSFNVTETNQTGSIGVSGEVTAGTGGIVLSAGSNILQQPGGALASQFITLTATNGNIGGTGMSGGALLVGSGASGVNQLNLNASAPNTGLTSNNGNITIVDNDADVSAVKPALLLQASAGNSALVDNTTGNLTVTETGGSIGIHPPVAPATVQASRSITFTAQQSIVQLHNEVIASPNITLTATQGTIGVNATTPFLTQGVTGNLVASANGSIWLANGGDLPGFTATSTTGSVSLGSFAAASLQLGNVNLAGNVSGTTGVNITLNSGNSLTNNAGGMFSPVIESTNAPINLVMDSYQLVIAASPAPPPANGALISAGTGTVSIVPATAGAQILLGATGTGLTLSNTQLNTINAGALSLGSSSASGSGQLIVGGNVTISAPANYVLQLITGGSNSYKQNGFSITDVGGLIVNVTGSGTIGADAITTSPSATGTIITLETNGGNITLSQNALAFLSGGASSISLVAGAIGTGQTLGALTLPNGTTALTVQPRKQGSGGGSVFLEANNLPTFKTTIDVDGTASGSGGTFSGNGGIASYITSSSSSPFATAGNLTINASGSNAGIVTVSAGGSMTVPQGSITTIASPANGSIVGTGNGAILTLVAGNSGTGNLLISGSLSAGGAGAFGSGGSILLESNSSSAFAIGSSSKTLANGISGTLSVAGSGNTGGVGNANGGITVINEGGGITDSQALIAVNSVTLTAGTGTANGPLTISQPIGSSTTSTIALTANGTGSIAPGANLLTASSISLTSTTGAITATTNTGSIGAVTGSSANVTIMNNNPSGAVLHVRKAGGGTIAITNTDGGITTDAGGISATTAVTLKTVFTNSSITVGGTITAGTTSTAGTITLNATGQGTIGALSSSDLLLAKTVSLSTGTSFGAAIGGSGTDVPVESANLTLNSPGNVYVSNSSFGTSPLTVVAASSSSSFNLTSNNQINFNASMPNAQAISLITTGASNIVVNGTLGSAAATGNVVLSSGTGSISGSGTIGSNGNVSLETGSGSFGTSLAPLKIAAPTITPQITASSSGAANVINITDTQASGQVNVNGGLTASGSVAFTSSSSINFNGAISGSTLSLTAHTENGVMFAKNLVATSGAITITATGSGAITGSNITAVGNVTLTAAGALSLGNVLASSGSVSLTDGGTTTLGSVNASGTQTGSGLVTIKQTGGGQLSLGAAGNSAAHSNFSVTTTGNGIVTSGTVSAGGILSLTSSSTTGSIGNTGMSPLLDASTINLMTGSGLGAGIGSVAVPLQIGGSGATALAANSTGSIFIQNTNSSNKTLTITAANPNNQAFNLISNTPITINPTLVNANSISINSAGALNIDGASLGGAINTGSITLNSGAGNISGKAVLTTNNVGVVNLISSSGSFGSSAGSPLFLLAPNFNPSTTGGNIFVSDKKTGTAAGTVNVSNLSTMGTVNFTSLGSTNINGDTTGSAVAGNAITLTLANNTIINGNISATGTGGAFLLNETGTGSTNFNLSTSGTLPQRSISAATGIAINTVGSTTFIPGAQVSASNGSLTVTENTGLLTTGLSSTFSEAGTSTGVLTLQEKANVAGSGIAVSNGSTLKTLIINPSSHNTFPLPGQVNLVIGATVPTTPANINTGTNNPNSNNIMVTVPTPLGLHNVYWGTTKITAPLGGNQLTVIGNAAIVFDAGTAAGISLGGNTTIIADPPALPALVNAAQAAQLVAVPVPLPLSLNSATNAVSSLNASSPSIRPETLAVSNLQIGNSEVSDTNFKSLVSFVSGNTNPLLSNLSTLSGGIQLQTVMQAQSSQEFGLASGSGSDPVWISETELAGGQIPALLSSDTEFGISADRLAAVSVLEQHNGSVHQSASADATHPGSAGVPPASKLNYTLAGMRHVQAANSGDCRTVSIKQGSHLLAPSIDTKINTPFGTIKVDAGSLVLIMSFADGLAVYDLDDLHQQAVSVSASGKQLHLYPGMNIVITSNKVTEFEQINPAQLLAYRNIARHDLNDSLRVFSTEFYVPGSIQAVLPLKQLVNSSHPNARRLVDHLLKTTAASMQMKAGGEQFRQIPRPVATAFAQ